MQPLHRYLSLPIVLFCASNGVLGQVAKTKTNQDLIWFAYNNTLQFAEKWALATDIQERRYVNPSAQHQFLVRTKLQYTLGQGWDVGAGGCIFWQSPNDPYSTSDPVVPELRPHIEFNQKQKTRYFRINHRYKAEARFFQHVQDGELRPGYSFRNFRLRYQLGFDLPLLKNKDKKVERLTLRVYDEIHLNAGDQVVANTFDQNRIFAGLIYSLTNDLAVEVGYLNWFQQQPSGNDFFNRNILRFAITHKIGLGKKKQATELPKS